MITKEFLHEQYVELRKSSVQISREFNIPKHTVCNKLVKYKIPTRPKYVSRLPACVEHLEGCKWCPVCKEEKPLLSFSKSFRERLGSSSYCKECSSKKAKKYFPAISQKRRKTKASLVLEFGNKCEVCGIENLPVDAFVFHHHSESMSSPTYLAPSKVITSQQKELILSEKIKWSLLCANCHSVQHGSGLTASQITGFA